MDDAATRKRQRDDAKRQWEEANLSEGEQEVLDVYRAKRKKDALDAWQRAIELDYHRAWGQRRTALKELAEERQAILECLATLDADAPLTRLAELRQGLVEVADERRELEEGPDPTLDRTQPMPWNWTAEGYALEEEEEEGGGDAPAAKKQKSEDA